MNWRNISKVKKSNESVEKVGFCLFFWQLNSAPLLLFVEKLAQWVK